MKGRRRRGLKLCRFFGYVSKIGPQSGLPARWWDDLDGALHVDGSKCYRGGAVAAVRDIAGCWDAGQGSPEVVMQGRQDG